MATSGTTSYSQTFLEIVNDAYALINVYGIGQTISAEDFVFASNQLNKMLKAWNAKGLHIWARDEGILFLDQYVGKYTFNSNAKATTSSDFIQTQLFGDHIALDTTIVVDSTTGMAANDKIGIVLTTKDIFWTTISAVTSTTTLTLTAGLSGAAYDNAMIFTYTNDLEKPLAIQQTARLVQGIDLGVSSTKTEIPFELVPYSSFMMIPVKSSNSTAISMAAYNPNRTTGDFYIFPRPMDCSSYIQFTYSRSIQDAVNSTDDMDLPVEWEECITHQLAVRLAGPYGRAATLQWLAPMASIMLTDLLSWDADHLYIELEP